MSNCKLFTQFKKYTAAPGIAESTGSRDEITDWQPRFGSGAEGAATAVLTQRRDTAVPVAGGVRAALRSSCTAGPPAGADIAPHSWAPRTEPAAGRSDASRTKRPDARSNLQSRASQVESVSYSAEKERKTREQSALARRAAGTPQKPLSP